MLTEYKLNVKRILPNQSKSFVSIVQRSFIINDLIILFHYIRLYGIITLQMVSENLSNIYKSTPIEMGVLFCFCNKAKG